MNSIEIHIENIGYNQYIFINLDTKTLVANNKQKFITDEDINNLLRIIRTWNTSYVDSTEIDSERFLIEIHTNDKTDIIEGKGKYPENYYILKNWIGEFYDRTRN